MQDVPRATPGRRRHDSDPLIRRSTLYALFEQAPATIAVLRGPDHVFELVNAAYQQLFPGRPLRGLPIRQALPELAGQGFFEILDRVYTTGQPYVAREARAMLDRRGDGKLEEAFFNFSYQPMYIEEKVVDGIIVFAFDVTEEVRRGKDRDEFLALISHEMRTPLTSILGWARMLRMGGLGPEMTEEALDALERSAQAQVRLIEDLLDDTRITSGKLRLSKRPLQIRSIIETAIADVAPAAEAKGIHLESSLGCEACPIFGDPTRLQQVIWNVLSNAIKFTPEGGTVSIDVERSGDRAVITIRDTGVGMDSGLLLHLFQRFRQADQSTDRKSGVGLGLAISKYLVEQHGGKIQAASPGKGKGSIFTIELPLTSENPDAFKTRDGKRTEGLPDLAGVHVLLVEDEADNRDVLATVLRRCGADVSCAASAEEGWEMLRDRDAAVIVCDIALPGADGCEFLTQVRSRSMTPALALTVFGARDQEEHIRACGFNAYRQKPIEPADLAHDVARLAQRFPTARIF